MDISMFFSFPGILITIGIALLLIAIVIGIFAYRNVGKEEYVRKYAPSDNENLPVDDIDMKEYTDGIKKEEKVVEEEQEPSIIEEVTLEEDKNDVINLEEEKEVSHDYIELNDSDKSFLINSQDELLKDDNDTKIDLEEKDTKKIYGGANPLDNVDLAFKNEKTDNHHEEENSDTIEIL